MAHFISLHTYVRSTAMLPNNDYLIHYVHTVEDISNLKTCPYPLNLCRCITV